tara:strand:- start:62 stop:526 length:465 start_codon:yes stop_codon:yes gene_type:complete
MSDYKQFKLTNGDEMICELVASGDEDSTADVIVRRAMKIVTTDDLEENIRYYTLKPWMSFQDDTTDLVALNSVHIVGEASPSETVMLHYAAALADADKYNKVKKAGLTLQEIQEKMQELTEEEMNEFLQAKYDEIADDSALSNIIQFKPKGTMH